jgi:hypothetical protein
MPSIYAIRVCIAEHYDFMELGRLTPDTATAASRFANSAQTPSMRVRNKLAGVSDECDLNGWCSPGSGVFVIVIRGIPRHGSLECPRLHPY